MKRNICKLFVIIILCIAIFFGYSYVKRNVSVKEQAKEVEVVFAENNLSQIYQLMFHPDDGESVALNEENKEFFERIFKYIEIKCEDINKESIVYEIKYPYMEKVFSDYENVVEEKERSLSDFYSYLGNYAKESDKKNKTVMLKYDYRDGETNIDYNNSRFIYAITGGLIDTYEDLNDNLLKEDFGSISKKVMTYGAEKDNNKSIELAWKSYLKNSGEDEAYFLVEDYDGDGKKEAFGITGSVVDDNSYKNVKIYFINSVGALKCVKDSTREGAPLYGFLSKQHTDGPLTIFNDSSKETCYITAKNSKFIVWEVSAHGSGSISIVLGVKNGEAYEPEISGSVMNFRQKESDEISALQSDFAEGFHDYIEVKYAFNETSGEFRPQ